MRERNIEQGTIGAEVLGGGSGDLDLRVGRAPDPDRQGRGEAAGSQGGGRHRLIPGGDDVAGDSAVITLAGLAILQDGPDGRVQVTLNDEAGKPVTYQYGGEVWTHVDTTSTGQLKVNVTVIPGKQETVAQNARQSLFDG